MSNHTLKRRTIIGVFVALLLIGTINSVRSQAKNAFYRVSTPFQQVFFGAGKATSDFFAGIFQGRQLRQEITILRTQNQELISQVSELDRLQKENAFLRDLLKTGLQRDLKFTIATITSYDIAQDSLIIDKGSTDGILKNMAVITGQRALVGKISEVFTNFSRVQLIFDKKSVFDANIQGKEIAGIVKGQGNGKLLLDLIPRASEIAIGNQVISSGIGKIFPAGILIGKIQDVKKSDLEAFQSATVKSAFDETATDKLLVITDTINETLH